MKKGFECCYMSVGGTYFYFDKEIVDDLGNEECDVCDMNQSCEYCYLKLTNQRKQK